MSLNDIPVNELPVVFLIAKGRSGTTLLQTILGSHPHIIAPFESRFVAHFRNRYGKVKKWSVQLKDRFIKDIITEMKIRYFWEIDIESLRDQLMKMPEELDYATVCREVYAAFISPFDKEEPQLIIDKNPVYSLLIHQLLKVFPNARFIHLVRDYRATINSVLKLLPDARVSHLAADWLLYQQSIEAIKKKDRKRWYTMKYESFLKAPESELKMLFEFLNVSYKPNLLAFSEEMPKHLENYVQKARDPEVKVIRKAGLLQVHRNLSSPIRSDFADKWKKEMTPKQIKIADKVCGCYAQRYGYTSVTSHLRVSRVPFLLQLERAKIRLYYRLPIRIRELKSKPGLTYLNGYGQ